METVLLHRICVRGEAMFPTQKIRTLLSCREACALAEHVALWFARIARQPEIDLSSTASTCRAAEPAVSGCRLKLWQRLSPDRRLARGTSHRAWTQQIRARLYLAGTASAIGRDEGGGANVSPRLGTGRRLTRREAGGR